MSHHDQLLKAINSIITTTGTQLQFTEFIPCSYPGCSKGIRLRYGIAQLSPHRVIHFRNQTILKILNNHRGVRVIKKTNGGYRLICDQHRSKYNLRNQ